MSETTSYPKWPGIVAIVALSLAGAVVVFLAGFAAGRCGGHPHPGMQPPMAMMGGQGHEFHGGQGGPGGFGHQQGPMGEHGLQLGPPRGEGPGLFGRGPDKKPEASAPAEAAVTAPAAKK